MADPVPALTYAAVFAAYTALIMGGAASIATFTDCDEASDRADGHCANVLHDIVQIVVVGIIPDAPDLVNLVFGAIGLACRLTLIVWLIEKGGGGAIVGGILGGVAALVAWLTYPGRRHPAAGRSTSASGFGGLRWRPLDGRRQPGH